MIRLLPVFLLAATPVTATDFRPVPVRTADQQAAINRFGNLAVAETVQDRCGRSFVPPVTPADKTAVAAQFALAQQSATLALRDAFPLEKRDHFAPYLERYRQHEVDAANAAIDRNGCKDPRVARMILLLHDLQTDLARAAGR